jgi:hypothetical protein
MSILFNHASVSDNCASRQPAGRRPRPDIVHSSLYLPERVYEALREAAFHERCKIHDLVMEGIGLALRKRGYRAYVRSRPKLT